MAIVNYTTEIEVSKTVGEIEAILVKYGATAILKEYDTTQQINAVNFKIITERGELPFKLPIKVREMQQIINNLVAEKKLPKKFFNDKEKAMKVGWRVIRMWIEAQMGLLEMHQTKVEEVFLPYMYSARTDQTLFQMLEKDNFKLLALPPPKETREEEYDE